MVSLGLKKINFLFRKKNLFSVYLFSTILNLELQGRKEEYKTDSFQSWKELQKGGIKIVVSKKRNKEKEKRKAKR